MLSGVIHVIIKQNMAYQVLCGVCAKRYLTQIATSTGSCEFRYLRSIIYGREFANPIYNNIWAPKVKFSAQGIQTRI